MRVQLKSVSIWALILTLLFGSVVGSTGLCALLKPACPECCDCCAPHTPSCELDDSQACDCCTLNASCEVDFYATQPESAVVSVPLLKLALSSVDYPVCASHSTPYIKQLSRATSETCLPIYLRCHILLI